MEIFQMQFILLVILFQFLLKNQAWNAAKK